MTEVLVAYASRSGATAEIAETVGQTLRDAGLSVTVRRCSEVESVDLYDAVVVGSALYVGRWEHDAVAFLRRYGEHLARRQTWLFQSGPCGEDAATEVVETPHRVERLVARFGLDDPVTFGGRLDPEHARDRLSRWMATGALAGDFRDWDVIRTWAEDVARVITAGPPLGMSPELDAALGE